MANTAPHRINAAALLLAAGEAALPALACGGQRICYEDLRRSVALAGAAWLECDVQPGELVLLRAEPDIEHVVAFLGAIWAGAVPMPLAATAVRLARHPQAGVRFVLDHTREGHADRSRDQVMTLAEWRMYLALARPAEPVRVSPDAPACWTEARGEDGGACLLTHGFALPAASGAWREGPASTAVNGALDVLRVLRRGGTAVLGPGPCASAPAGARREAALP